MAEHPILFSTEMVKAILDGRKTTTRRVIKTAFDGHDWAGSVHPDGAGEGWIAWWPDGTAEDTRQCYPNGGGFKCPYGQPGDRLWVRETFVYESIVNRKILYKADYPIGRTPWDYSDMVGAWRPSIHMPRWASRIALEVTGVRVERLNDISVIGAIDEGVKIDESSYSYVGNFKTLWDKINARRGYSWDSNPWVWVVEFKQLSNPAASGREGG